MSKVAMLFLCPMLCFAGQIVSVVTLPKPIVVTNTEAYVMIPGCEQEYDPGKPNIPLKTVEVEIPTDEVVSTIKIELMDSFVLNNVPNLATVQPPISDNVPQVRVDPKYDMKEYYPDLMMRTYAENMVEGKKKVFVFFYPVSYRYLTDTLRYSTTFKIIVNTKKDTNQKPRPTPRVLSQGPARYIIISTNSLYEYQGEYSIQSLLDYRSKQGFTTRYIPLEWIRENFTGRDTQEKIRHFCQEAYQTWKTEFVLLIGDDSIIPFRYFAVDNIPSDHVYYGCLDGDMDHNNNNVFGEIGDSESGQGKCDVIAEIKVGRFPVYTTNQLVNVIRKTMLREQNPFVVNHGLMGECLNPLYPSVFMEDYLIKPNSYYGQTTVGYSTTIYTNDFKPVKLYDSDGYRFATADVMSFFNSNMSYVAHIGHGSTIVCFKTVIWPTTLDQLTNNVYPVVFSIACDAGGMDLTTWDCVAQSMLFNRCAASAVCMNTRSGWYSNDGQPCYSFAQERVFTDGILRGMLYLGDVVKRTLDWSGTISLSTSWGFSVNDKVLYTVMFFGDPASPVFPTVFKDKVEIVDLNVIQTSNVVSATFGVTPAGYYNPDVEMFWETNRIEVVRTNNHYESSVFVNQMVSQQVYSVRAIGINGLSEVITGMMSITNTNPVVVTNIPPVITNTPPVVTNITIVVTNVPPVVTNTPPVITNTPPVVVITNTYAVARFFELPSYETFTLRKFVVGNIGSKQMRVKVVCNNLGKYQWVYNNKLNKEFVVAPRSDLAFTIYMVNPSVKNEFLYSSLWSSTESIYNLGIFIVNIFGDNRQDLVFTIQTDDYYNTSTNFVWKFPKK